MAKQPVPIAVVEPRGSRSPRRAIAVALAVLLVAWYCFPGGVAGWVGDHCADGAFCAAFQTVADSVDAASRSVGVAGTLEGWRDSLKMWLGIDSY
jgi:hypothetical protein